nr:hypothetical protein [Tanacetum cinerariifolium]
MPPALVPTASSKITEENNAKWFAIFSRVDDLVNADSDSEVDDVFNETASFIASTSSKVDNNFKSCSGVRNKSLYKQQRETYNEDSYDDDDFDDCELTNAQLKLANAFDISFRGQLR